MIENPNKKQKGLHKEKQSSALYFKWKRMEFYARKLAIHIPKH